MGKNTHLNMEKVSINNNSPFIQSLFVFHIFIVLKVNILAVIETFIFFFRNLSGSLTFSVIKHNKRKQHYAAITKREVTAVILPRCSHQDSSSFRNPYYHTPSSCFRSLRYTPAASSSARALQPLCQIAAPSSLLQQGRQSSCAAQGCHPVFLRSFGRHATALADKLGSLRAEPDGHILHFASTVQLECVSDPITGAEGLISLELLG